jgi:radical S-adenosyl methionine domain-containing protein 2
MLEKREIMIKNSIVVNWHLLEACQLKCKYCYAEWDKEDSPLIFKCSSKSEELMRQISLIKGYKNIRLSFAGGEPLLDKKLSNKISYAYKNNFEISIITNGALLTENFLYENCSKISMLGISIDSFDHNTNLSIGRTTLLGEVPNYENIIYLIHLARKINPHILIKINTVVNEFNFNEDMSSIIKLINPNKWKILKVLPATKKSKSQEISASKFKKFISRHLQISCISIENNEAMFNSYLMIDPYGRFFYNLANSEYGYSKSILSVGIDEALKMVDFNQKKFNNRYSKNLSPVLHQ